MTRILIVEDSRTQAEQLRLILETEGFDADVANDAEEALERLDQAQFDLVISDILMPGLNGYELCRRVKRNEITKKLPIILLTTLNDPMDIIQGLECGADNFITKPYEPDYLIARVRGFLDNRHLRATQKLKLGVDIAFLGRTFTISSDKEQILDLLIATFEDIVRTNRQLQESRAELTAAKAKVEEYANRLEGRVHASEEKYLRLFETANDAILIADADTGTVIDANPGALRLIGRPADAVVGRQISTFFSDDKAEDILTLLSGLADAADSHMREGSVLRTDGHRVPVEVSASKLELNGKRLLHTALRDVSERRLLEQQLRQAQRMEAIGQLTGGIAHDFNNLLGVVIGNLDLLHEEVEDNPELAELARSALNGATRGADLVRRLLAFSRKQPLRPQAIDLNEHLPDAVAMLHRTLGERVAVVAAPGPDLWRALADPSQVEDVIINLAINARDAMPKGGRLTIETANVELDADYAAQHAEVTAGDYVLLAVSDTGTGMPQEVIDRAFEPFFSTKEAGRGSGLGLSQVYGFVKQSGGHIKIYSELGHGTTIKIYLPRAKDEEAAVNRRTARSEDIPTGTEKILVVEDDSDVRRVAVKQLRDLGYDVHEAENARSALAVLDRADAVDLIFTDIVMPGGMTGYDLAREARQRRPAQKVLFTSGYTEIAAQNGDVDESGGRPRANLLSKPYRKAELARKIRSVLDHEA